MAENAPTASVDSESSLVVAETSKFLLLSTKERMRYLTKNPDFSEQIYLAYTDYEDGNNAKAKEAALKMHENIEKGYDDNSDRVVKLMRLSRLEFKLGMKNEADELFNRGLKMFNGDDGFGSGNSINHVAWAAVNEGRVDDVLKKSTEITGPFYRDSLLGEVGETLMEKGEVDQVLSIFSKIETPSEKIKLGGMLVTRLVGDSRIDEAKAVNSQCETITEPKDEYQKSIIFSQYNLLGQNEKAQEILHWFNEKFGDETGDLRRWLDTTSRYAGLLIEAKQFDNARLVTDNLQKRIDATLLLEDDEWGGDKSNAKIASGRIVELNLLLGDSDTAMLATEKYGERYNIGSSLKLVNALLHNGDVENAVRITDVIIADIMSTDSINFWVVDELFDAAGILIENGRPPEEVANLIAQAGQKITGSDMAKFGMDLGNFNRKYFPNTGERVDFNILASKFTVDGEPDWDLIKQAIFIADAKDIEIIIGSLPEKDRERALTLIHKESLQYDTEYANENRAEIYDRTRRLLIRDLNANPDGVDDRGKVKVLIEMLVKIGDKDAKDLLLNLTQQEVEKISESGPTSNTLRLIKTLAELNTNRGNDFLFGVLGDERLGYHESLYLLRKLVENRYISSDVFDWLRKRNNKRLGLGLEAVQTEHSIVDIKVIKLLINKSRLNPSEEILNMLAGEVVNEDPDSRLMGVEDRMKKIQESRKDVEEATSAEDLIKRLSEDKDKAKAYYILNNGNTKFDLINNYSFEKFWEIVSITSRLKVHEGPIGEFNEALTKVGFSEEERKAIIANLKDGHNPFYSPENPSMEMTIRLDVTNNQQYETATKDIGNIFGKDQVGLIIKSTFYRRYLTEVGNNELLTTLNKSSNLQDRQSVISKIEAANPQFIGRVIQEVGPDWGNLENKMSFGGVSIESLLTESSNSVTAEAVITKIEEKREELKTAKKGLLSALKNENAQIVAINREILRKRKAIEGLRKGAELKPELNERIQEILVEISSLESQVEKIGFSPVESRFAGLDEGQRAAQISQENQALQALTEKDPSMVLMYLIAELAGGEGSLIENDINVAKEVGSHLEGPIQMVVDLAKLDRTNGSERIEKTVRIRMLDKKDDLMTMVRFADSKICCFSSNNYQMRVAHNIENKNWVAAMNADPLSFVFEIEDFSNRKAVSDEQTKNLGFIFGMYGVSEDGEPEIMLNGVYYSGGNDMNTVTNTTDAIELMLSQKIKAQHQFISSKYGGKINGNLAGYSNESVTAKRLRAIDDGDGNPVVRIYDDLGTEINTVMDFSGDVLHKVVPRAEVQKEVVEEMAEELTIGEPLSTQLEENIPTPKLTVREKFRRFLKGKKS